MSLEHLLIQLLNGLYRPSGRRPRGRDLVLGKTHTQQRDDLVILAEAARSTHLGIIGLSGVGKTYLLENLIRQDIERETGFVLFDVHGDLADSVIAFLARHVHGCPRLADRVVLVEPFDPCVSVGFNPLERSNGTSPYFQAQELTQILRERWQSQSFGPRTEELLRNALFTISANELTLLELPHLLTNHDFRQALIRGLAEPAVVDYWKNRYEPLSDPMKAVVREPLLTRISAFLADPQIREIVGQRRSTFSFQNAIASGLWVILNLSKGKLGENSAVLGSLFFTKLQLDVMARSRVPESERKLFAIYADELQNLAGRNIATLVAEARKYRVSLTAGHQFWHQLPPDLRAAMASVGTRVFFRLNYHDARELAGELDPSARQWYTEVLTRLPRGRAIVRTGAERPVPITVTTRQALPSSLAEIDWLRQHTTSRYAMQRSQLRQDVTDRYSQPVRAALSELLGRPHS